MTGRKKGAQTKAGTKAAKPGPKGKRGRAIGPAAALAQAFLGTQQPQTPQQRAIINHLPVENPKLTNIMFERLRKKPLIQHPDHLMEIAQEYFEWCENNPLWEDRLVTFQGFASHEPVPKMRLRTIEALCFFLGINTSTWYLWRKTRDDLKEAIEAIETRITVENKHGASAELMNANFVARVLGLADRQEHTGKDGGPLTTQHVDIDLSKLTEEELDAYRAAAEAIERIRSNKANP